jgi:hypothetical protein
MSRKRNLITTLALALLAPTLAGGPGLSTERPALAQGAAARGARARMADDSAWSALGAGVNGEVLAIAVSGSDVYVGGMFDSAGDCTTGCNNIAKWDTTTGTWSALGTGVDGEVLAIAVSGSDVYIGGEFYNAGPIPSSRIAVWGGSTWSALDTEVNGGVRAIAVGGSDVYVGGYFAEAGGCTGAAHGCYFIARWNNPVWSALDTGTDSYVLAIADGGTRVYAGGIFSSASGVTDTVGIASWDKPGWYALGTGMSGIAGYSVNAIAVSGSDVYAGGMFDSAGGVPAANIARWNSGSGWSALGSGIGDNGAVRAIAVSGSGVYVGGDFHDRENGAPNYIAKWNSGSGWSALGQGTDGKVYAIAVSGTNIYVGGSFTHAGGKDAHGIANYSIASFYVYLPSVLRSQ